MTKISNQGRTLDNPTLAMVETVSIAWYVGVLYNSTTSKKVEMKLSTRQHNQCIAKYGDIPGSLWSTSSDWPAPRRNVTFSRCRSKTWVSVIWKNALFSYLKIKKKIAFFCAVLSWIQRHFYKTWNKWRIFSNPEYNFKDSHNQGGIFRYASIS